jgi:antitoxin component YwqK of YwqJK toxin-antitoxin module
MDFQGRQVKQRHIEYHIDGSIWAMGDMVDGKCEGYWEWFRKDGTRMRSGYFEKGKQVGEWTTYDKEGNIVKVTQLGEK